MGVLIVSNHRLGNICHSTNSSARCRHKRTYIVTYSTLYCPLLTENEFSRQMSMKGSNVKFHENPFSRSEVVPCGRKERRTNGRWTDRQA